MAGVRPEQTEYQRGSMVKTTKKTAAKSAMAEGKKKTAKKTAGKKTAATKKAPVKKKSAAKKKPVAKKPATAKKTAVRKKAAGAREKPTVRRISLAERHRLIAEAAYLRSEAQGFFGDARQDWLAAEAEIDERLSKAGIAVED